MGFTGSTARQRDIMCDRETYEAAKDVVEFQTHLGIPLKGFPNVCHRLSSFPLRVGCSCRPIRFRARDGCVLVGRYLIARATFVRMGLQPVGPPPTPPPSLFG